MPGRIRKVAFLGTGIMGAPIAGHLMDAGFELTVYNRTVSKTDALVARGAKLARTPEEAVRGAELVFTMLGYPTDVEEVYLGGGGILEASEPGAWLVDLTTSSPSLARDIAETAEVMGKHAVDVPVTGGQSGAEAGTLTLIVGGSEQACEPIREALESFSSKIFYFDAPGSGQAAKLCNQISLASCMMGMSDMLAFAEQYGLNVPKVAAMVGSGMGSSVALTNLGAKVLEGDFAPGFMVEHFRKDLGLALEQADEMDVTLPGTETAYTLYDLLCELGGARLGTQSIALLYSDEETGSSYGLDWSVIEGMEDDHDHDRGFGHHHHHHHDED
ncbi:MAG: NAD(P)-dependent oxidoreductase [Atopobiaceae bacterium]|nr:NAD(P)-dependent oxidoreductase [Atopobiaceae bacterium]